MVLVPLSAGYGAPLGLVVGVLVVEFEAQVDAGMTWRPTVIQSVGAPAVLKITSSSPVEERRQKVATASGKAELAHEMTPLVEETEKPDVILPPKVMKGW